MVAVVPSLECSLADLPVGIPARVAAMDREAAQRLGVHGFRLGAALRIERDAPFHGPRIVCLGGARIAVAAAIARSVRVRLEAEATPRP